jgi:hypothetical protein
MWFKFPPYKDGAILLVEAYQRLPLQLHSNFFVASRAPEKSPGSVSPNWKANNQDFNLKKRYFITR